ncbi:MAG: protein jag [Oscillospiraceae bacterium]|nr:protein jag [Oscillospiraceae bacterium]
MKRETIVSAKTIEAALERGIAQLGVDKSRVEYEVLTEPKKGFLGLGETMAQVRVFVPEKGEAKSAEPAPKAAPQPKSAPAPKAPPKAKTEPKPTPKASPVADDDGFDSNKAVEFLQEVIANMGLSSTVTLEDCGREKKITISGEGAGALIGYHGEGLDALQYLATLAANKRGEDESRSYNRISLDIEGYRAKREATLTELAHRTADKVQRYGRSVALEPMPSHERRIIHVAIQDMDGISSYSIGENTRRRIVICLAGEEGKPVRTDDRGGRRGYSRR